MKLYIDKKLNLNKQKCNFLSDFCIFCADKLPIEGDFKPIHNARVVDGVTLFSLKANLDWLSILVVDAIMGVGHDL